MKLRIVAVILLTGGMAAAQSGLILPALYAVQGAPFTAVVETVQEGSQSAPARSESRIIRDAAGRQRFETPTLEEAAALGKSARVVIYDPLRERIIQLDLARRTATVTAMRRVGRTVSIDVNARKGFPCFAGRGGESLGLTQVAGLEACAQRVGSRQLWLSTAYLMPLMSITEAPNGLRLTHRVVRMDAQEPAAALFEVPPGYTLLGP